MANLPEVSSFDSVYQIEATDYVSGGASGTMNVPLKALVNRTKYLFDQLANYQPVNALLTAIAGLASNGIIARTAAGTSAARTLTGTAAEITVTNGDGVAGNPTFSLPTALTFTGKTVTGGTYTAVAGITTAGAITFTVDNTVDFGASGAFRPRTGYFGTSVFTPQVIFNANGSLGSSGDGIFRLLNNAGTDFARLCFGGTTSAFPSFKRSGAGLDVRLADDSAYANMRVGQLFLASGSRLGEAADGIITLYNSAGTDFTRLNFGGNTSAFSALRRSGSGLDIVLADNSAYATLRASKLLLLSGSTISDPADGQLTLSNSALTDFTRLNFGGTTASFPSLKRSAAGFAVRLADDTGYTYLDAAVFNAYVAAGPSYFFGGVTSAFPALKRSSATLQARLADDTGWARFRALDFQLDDGTIIGDVGDGILTLTNAANTDFGRVNFGGSTSAFPALRRSGTAIQVRLGDDSAYASFESASILSSSSITAGSGNSFGWSARSKMASGVDGNIVLTNNAGTDFTLLQFGGTSSSFPAFRRLGTVIEAALADVSGYTAFRAASFRDATYGAQLTFSTTANVRAGTDTLATVGSMYAALAEVAITETATITPDLTAGRNFSTASTGTRTLANPTGQVAGQSGRIRVAVGVGAGPWSFGTNWKWVGGAAPTVSTTNGDTFVIFYDVVASGTIFANYARVV